MITAPLQEQVRFEERLANPNYLIIVQNKAPQMDFSQFKIIGPNGENYRIKLRKRFLMTCLPIDDKPGYSIIKVTEIGHEVVGLTCRNECIDKWLTKFKREYDAKLENPILTLIPKEDDTIGD